MGIASVIVTSQEEAASRHVDAADRFLEVALDESGAIPTAELERVLAESEADAVHLGYQGQPHMWELASAAERADLAVIGTDLDVLGALADSSTVHAAAERAHVRVAHDAPALVLPRQVGVLVAADSEGETAAIGECERTLSHGDHCLIHESPSPELVFRSDGEAFRLALFESARRVASELRYAGLLEIEFLLDADGLAWVNGVTIGLPRQHTLIEMTTRVDLVNLQIRIAAGEGIPDDLHGVEARGHALAASILATENADAPVGSFFIAPAPQGRVRADSSATVGMALPADDRPLIAKVTTYEPVRHRAMLTMDRLLAELRTEPFETNVGPLRRILADYAFRAGQYDSSANERFSAA